jgi:hypothetical protein
MKEMELKGAAFFGTLTCVEKLHGAAVRAAVMKALPPALEEKLRTRVMVVGGWYPSAWYRDLMAAVRTQLHTEAELRALGRASAELDMTTLYRALFRVVSPERLARNSDRVLGTFYRGDFKVTVVEVTKGLARVDFEGFHGIDKWLWLDAIAGFELVFEMVGAKNPRATIESGGDGPNMRLALRWD